MTNQQALPGVHTIPDAAEALRVKHGLDDMTPRSILLLGFDLARSMDYDFHLEAPYRDGGPYVLKIWGADDAQGGDR